MPLKEAIKTWEPKRLLSMYERMFWKAWHGLNYDLAELVINRYLKLMEDNPDLTLRPKCDEFSDWRNNG